MKATELNTPPRPHRSVLKAQLLEGTQLEVWRKTIRVNFSEGQVVNVDDIVQAFKGCGAWRAFNKVPAKSQELLAESAINVLIVDGVLSPIGLDTYLVKDDCMALRA